MYIENDNTCIVCTHYNRLDEAILMRTHNITYFHIKEKRKKYTRLIMTPDFALWFTLISSNCLRLENIFMVPKVFEPWKLYCIYLKKKTTTNRTTEIPMVISFNSSSCRFESDAIVLFYTSTVGDAGNPMN